MRTSCTQSPSLNFPHPLRAAINPTVSHNMGRLPHDCFTAFTQPVLSEEPEATKFRHWSIHPRTTRRNVFGAFVKRNRNIVWRQAIAPFPMWPGIFQAEELEATKEAIIKVTTRASNKFLELSFGNHFVFSSEFRKHTSENRDWLTKQLAPCENTEG